MITNTFGQLPAALTSLLVTAKLASQASLITVTPPKAIIPATVVAADGAALASHPSVVIAVKLPVTTGAVVSSILIVCTISVELLQSSVTV